MSDIIHLLINSNTLNFFIVLAILVVIVVKLNLKDKIEVLRDEIRTYVEASVNEKKVAEQNLSLIKEKIQQLPSAIEDIEKSTENSVKSIGEKIKADIQEQKQDIANSAERIFNLETKKFKQKLTSVLSEKSVEIARDNAINQLKENNELHNKYINNAIEELDRINL
ncbi:MAG: hypothetical protein IJY61_05545 [Candidatus Gastranaerophilales bacterium]|nr:hypothetical protein [Candidatus Gastranaerophilales bacterium]